jgi:hypothetical protein
MSFNKAVFRAVQESCVVVCAFRSRNGASSGLLRLVADGTLKPSAGAAWFLE